MPTTASLRPTRVGADPKKSKRIRRAPWCLSVPPELSATGRRQRLFFATEREARVESEKLKARKDNFGLSLASLTPERIAQAGEAFKLLDPLNIGLLDAVRAHIALVKARSQSVTFGAAFNRFAELKKNKSPAYRQEIRYAKETFEPLLDRMICEITAADLEPMLDQLPGASRNAKIRRLCSVFNLAIRRGWFQGINPTKQIDRAEIARKEVE